MSVGGAFDLSGKVVVVTGAAGLLGRGYAAAIAEMGGIPVLCDIDGPACEKVAAKVSADFGVEAMPLCVDITDAAAIEAARDAIIGRFGAVHGLVNNAARNPRFGAEQDNWTRLESLPLELWSADLAVGLTGAFLCSRAFGPEMARRGRGSIVNIASDLALIGPDQRLYRKAGLPDEAQPVKPVTYSVIKAGLVGLTRYMATYWSDRGVRVNALCPGGVFDGQDAEFVSRLSNLIPLGRMARADEYQASIVFLLSDASSYMTGSVMTVDGGRTAW